MWRRAVRMRMFSFSPLSVFVALTMTETGAAGKTQTTMRHALAVLAA